MTTIALCIPHTPWVPVRVEAMKRLKESLGLRFSDPFADAKRLRDESGPQHYLELTDKAPNDVWSVAMWKWMLKTGADFCLTLQDDALVAPCFWPALRAMLTQLPKGHVLGLSGVHPMAREIARRGHRWYRTKSWVIGWAYGWWREDLERFLEWRLSDEGEKVTQAILPNGEDALQNIYIPSHGLDVWHPVPTIVDHDTSIDSSYDNDDHGHRRPWVTWRAYDQKELVHPEFWLVNGKAPTHYHTVPQHICWWCGVRQPIRGSQKTGAAICGVCIHETMGSILSALEGR